MREGIRLGVDVGTVRVGVAVSDPGGIMATPVETLARASASDKDVQRVAELADDARALEVVVGLPRSLSGREGPAAVKVRERSRTASKSSTRAWPGWTKAPTTRRS